MIRVLALLLGTCAFLSLMAQGTAGSVHLHFTPMFQGNALVIQDETEQPAQADITAFRCYLSTFALMLNGQVVWSERNSFHLLDAADPTTLEVELAAPQHVKYDAVQFQLGIDSLTSVSGAMGGDLDPTKGMYWTWNSGYINLKLEGHNPKSTGRNGAFEFHLGGYLPPYATARTIVLDGCGASVQHITIRLDQFLGAVDLQAQNHVMSPGQAAFDLSSIFATIFHCENAQ